MIDHVRDRLRDYAPLTLESEGRPRAAVLIPLFARDGEVHVVFTKRSDTVGRHKGEICFPGGAIEIDDVDATMTALRESDEEIGLLPQHVEIVGRLDDSISTSAFHITAFVGAIEPTAAPYVWRPTEAEVAVILEVPVSHLLNRDNLIEVPRERDGRLVILEGFRFGEHVIWGATGRILRNFLDVVSPGWPGTAVPTDGHRDLGLAAG